MSRASKSSQGKEKNSPEGQTSGDSPENGVGLIGEAKPHTKMGYRGNKLKGGFPETPSTVLEEMERMETN